MSTDCALGIALLTKIKIIGGFLQNEFLSLIDKRLKMAQQLSDIRVFLASILIRLDQLGQLQSYQTSRISF
jgi:hypothetical protein